MKATSLSILLGLGLFTITSIATAAEPAYCNPKTFYSKEIKHGNTKLKRARMFQLGETKVMGVAVGDSKAEDLVDFAYKNSDAKTSDKFCTWYYNDGNEKAEAWFNWNYVSNPMWMSPSTGAKKFSSALKNEFSKDETSFLSCAQNHKYIAMGCNGQKHRGPSVFGMMLAYSGCSVNNAATIVNTIWGLNGVGKDTRLAIINEGKKFGDADPEGRRRLQQSFGEQ